MLWSLQGSIAFISTWVWLPLIQSICLHGGYAESQGMPPVDVVVCSTQEQCQAMFSSMFAGGNFLVGDYQTKGCFYSNGDVHFGTGGSVEEINLAASDLPGNQERIWCNKDINAPTMSPSNQLTLATDSATDSTPAGLPTSFTNRPTAKQSISTLSIATSNTKPSFLTVHPMSIKPTTFNSTIQPTPMSPVPGNPTSQPSHTVPSTKQPTPTSVPSAKPTIQRAVIKVTDSSRPTTRPSDMPATRQPTANPSYVPSSSHLTKQPTLAQVTASPSNKPSKMPVTNLLTANPTPLPTAANPTTYPTLDKVGTVPQEEQDVAPFLWYPVGVSPLALSLFTDPQTESVDINELTLFILNHLLKEMEEIPLSIEGSSSYIVVSPVPVELIQVQDTLGSDPSKEFGFVFTGLFYFSDNSLPTVEMLDVVAWNSFAGENGEDFIHSLRNADDTGLRSTRSVSAVSSNESNKVEVVESSLESAKVNPSTSNRWYLLTVVFGIGLLLISMKMYKSNHSKGEIPNMDSKSAVSDEQSSRSKCGESSSRLSKCSGIGQESGPFQNSSDEISVRSVYDSIRDAMSEISLENIRGAASDLMSLLSNPTQADDENNSIQVSARNDTSTTRAGNPGPDLNGREVQIKVDHTPSYWNQNDDGSSSYNSQLGDCIFCGLLGTDESVPSEHGTGTEMIGNKSQLEVQSCAF